MWELFASFVAHAKNGHGASAGVTEKILEDIALDWLEHKAAGIALKSDFVGSGLPINHTHSLRYYRTCSNQAVSDNSGVWIKHNIFLENRRNSVTFADRRILEQDKSIAVYSFRKNNSDGMSDQEYFRQRNFVEAFDAVERFIQ
jgi:hypothetical protein